MLLQKTSSVNELYDKRSLYLMEHCELITILKYLLVDDFLLYARM